jgi:NADPH-dependent 2,4-dienoyl-CoA reductase/sulfur reductase-like enzyme
MMKSKTLLKKFDNAEREGYQMRIVIIGATAAGTTAAAKVRRLNKDAEVVLYERGNITSFGACGLTYFVGNYFEDYNEMIARTPEQFEKSGVRVLTGHEVKKLDAINKTLEGVDLKTGEAFSDHYDKLMIATGASAVLPPFIQACPQGVFLLRTLEDGLKLKEAAARPEVKRVVVVGAGYIGLETASAMKHLGKEVTVVELKDRVLSEGFDPEITDIIQRAMEAEGIKILLDTMVEKLEGDPVEMVVTTKGKYNADLVVISTGVRPETAWLAGSGLEFLPNGAIVVDDEGRTALQDVYAAGDCATVYHALLKKQVYIPLATVANKLGRIVGENLAGMHNKLDKMIGAAGIKVLQYEAVRVGINEDEAVALGYDAASVFIEDKDHASYYPGREEIYLKLIYDKNSKRILGGQVTGKLGAALRGHVLSAAVVTGMTTDELGLLDLAYNPAFTRTWDVLNVAGNVAK